MRDISPSCPLFAIDFTPHNDPISFTLPTDDRKLTLQKSTSHEITVSGGRRIYGLSKIPIADTIGQTACASIFRGVTDTELQVGTVRHPELLRRDDYR